MIHISYFRVCLYILDVKNEITKRNGKKAQFIDKDKEYEKNIWQQCWRQQKNEEAKKSLKCHEIILRLPSYSHTTVSISYRTSSLSNISLIFPPNFPYSLHLYCLIYLTFHILIEMLLNKEKKLNKGVNLM